MKFIYFYSDLYNFYHEHIQQNLSSHFELEYVKIGDLKGKDGHTFNGGVSIKIEILIDKIKENMGDFIVFSDATIFINSKNAQLLPKYLDNYKIYDMTFANNTLPKHLDPKRKQKYNIGFILLKCNEKVLNFYKDILEQLKVKKGHDQTLINDILRHNKNIIPIGIFDDKIHCGYDFKENYRDSFYVYKGFIKHLPTQVDNFNFRLKKLHDSNLIDEDTYTRSIK